MKRKRESRVRSAYTGWAVVIRDLPTVAKPGRRFAGRYWWFGHPPAKSEPQIAGHWTCVFETRRLARQAVARAQDKTGTYRLDVVCVDVVIAERNRLNRARRGSR